MAAPFNLQPAWLLWARPTVIALLMASLQKKGKKKNAIGVSELWKVCRSLSANRPFSFLPSLFVRHLSEGNCEGHEIGMCFIMECFAVFMRTHTKKNCSCRFF